MDTMQVTNAIERMRSQEKLQISQEDFLKIEQEVQNILVQIKETDILEDAEDFFKNLETIQTVLSKIAFKDKIELTSKLRKFVREFDRLDDTEFKERLLSKIRNGYSFLND